MATVIAATPADIVSNAAATVVSLDAKLAKAAAYVEAEKSKIVGALNAHIAAHEATIVAHQKEVSAAEAIIAKAIPAAPVQADNAAALILTSSSQVQGVVNFLGKNWRYVVGAIALIICAVGYRIL